MLFLDDVKYDKISILKAMAGHSKWANIKRKKEVVDKKKGNVFTKHSRAITMAVIEGNGATNPDFNVRLRIAMEQARAANMPKENIERAIQKGSGANREELAEFIYEGFGTSGSAILIKITTDNQNRSIAEIRTILEKNGGKLAGKGAVQYLFQIENQFATDEAYTPYATLKLESREEEEQLIRLLEKLEAHDDVQAVFTNVLLQHL